MLPNKSLSACQCFMYDKWTAVFAAARISQSLWVSLICKHKWGLLECGCSKAYRFFQHWKFLGTCRWPGGPRPGGGAAQPRTVPTTSTSSSITFPYQKSCHEHRMWVLFTAGIQEGPPFARGRVRGLTSWWTLWPIWQKNGRNWGTHVSQESRGPRGRSSMTPPGGERERWAGIISCIS